MNLRTRQSRSNGYRELGMYDESIPILEDIPFEEDRWHSSVVEARYNPYRDAKEWEHANAMSRLMCKRRPSTLRWRLNDAGGHHKLLLSFNSFTTHGKRIDNIYKSYGITN